MVRRAGPICQLGELNIKGDYREPSRTRIAQNLLIVTPIEVRIAGVDDLVTILTQRLGDFNADILS